MALFRVVILLDQKFMSKKDVIPISSHPRNNVTHEPAKTSKVIDHPKSFRKTRKLTMPFSKRMYENA